MEEVLPQKERSKKQKGKREADLKDFPEEMLYTLYYLYKKIE